MSSYLETANEIGQRLATEAIWHQDRCNWVGAKSAREPDGSSATTYATLGPDLYGGTSGVGLFLSELYRHTGDDLLRRTALGALRHAVSSAETLPRTVRGALYEGGLGVALAAAISGRLLTEQGPLTVAATLAEVTPLRGSGHDLMSGDAGAVVGLLALAELLREAAAGERAIRFGAQLLAAAVDEDGTLSWPSPGTNGRPRLTGLSNGAAGAALAFLELWHATAEQRYLLAAESAFKYERRLFDPIEANWPDLRSDVARRPDAPRRFATLWCHGAPGIALSRLRAVELGLKGPVRREARIALDTTRRAVETELAHEGNFSLCHGLSGNAEILLHGAITMGAERAEDAALAHRVAEEGIERYAGSPQGWPCGTPGGETASLFLGLAGIGRFYLRLHDSQLPSLILPRSEELGAVRASLYPSPSSLR